MRADNDRQQQHARPNIFLTDSHHSVDLEFTPKAAPMLKGVLKIGSNCCIGANKIVLKDIELGNGCVIGAGAVVTRNFPENSIVGRVQAKLIWMRT